ncbi:hypothetical protein L596_022120 [Steinernema carpocapsae]|uniref:F-box associated domain-containing protein n=1 Tax=Steinernema carpocapsae TaxID=34508 RepID=A0A4U5MKW6_STECR|nr:hypothetical protein L596_022120 [Steinernema carpocapsae]
MNSIPTVFCESALFVLDSYLYVAPTVALISGKFGFCANRLIQEGHIKNYDFVDGKHVGTVYFDYHDKLIKNDKSEKFNEKYAFQTSVFLRFRSEKISDMNLNLFGRILSTKNVLELCLETAYIPESWVKFVSSWANLKSVEFYESFDDSGLTLLTNLVQKQQLHLCNLHQPTYEKQEMKLLMYFLTQEQARFLTLRKSNQIFLKKLLKIWNYDSKKLNKKIITFQGYVNIPLKLKMRPRVSKTRIEYDFEGVDKGCMKSKLRPPWLIYLNNKATKDMEIEKFLEGVEETQLRFR